MPPEKQGKRKKEEDLTLAEYKLVPVEEVESIEQEEMPIDLIAEIKNLWNERVTILKVLGIVLGIGLFIYLFSQRYYSSDITLMPEVQSPESSASRLLRQYGGFLGIGGPDQTTYTETISIDLYPEIVVSTPFQLELIQEELYFSKHDTTVSLYTYYHDIRDVPFFEWAGDLLEDLTINLPSTIRGLFSGSSQRPPVDFEAYEDREGPFDLDGRISRVISYTSDLISVQQEPQTGFVVIRAELPDPEASAQLVKTVKEQLTEYVTEYRTEKVMKDLEFVEQQYREAKRRFQVAQDSLAAFRDRNQNLVTARARTQEQRLQAEYDLRLDVYNTLAQRLEQSKLKVQEETPVFSTLEPVTISNSPSTPDPVIIFIGSTFLGFFFGVGYVYFRRLYDYFVQEFKSK